MNPWQQFLKRGLRIEVLRDLYYRATMPLVLTGGFATAQVFLRRWKRLPALASAPGQAACLAEVVRCGQHRQNEQLAGRDGSVRVRGNVASD